MDTGHRSRNDAARNRLSGLLDRLKLKQLDEPLGGGWTVKVALLHLAFWDRFAAATLQQWQRTGFTPSGDDGASINVAALDDWLAAPPDYALREVLRAANLADRTAANTSGELRATIAAGGEAWALERGRHRIEHIEQIERALATARTTAEL